jgi:hypothetical protein
MVLLSTTFIINILHDNVWVKSQQGNLMKTKQVYFAALNLIFSKNNLRSQINFHLSEPESSEEFKMARGI